MVWSDIMAALGRKPVVSTPVAVDIEEPPEMPEVASEDSPEVAAADESVDLVPAEPTEAEPTKSLWATITEQAEDKKTPSSLGGGLLARAQTFSVASASSGTTLKEGLPPFTGNDQSPIDIYAWINQARTTTTDPDLLAWLDTFAANLDQWVIDLSLIHISEPTRPY